MANAVGFVDFKRRGELHLCMAFLQWSFNVVKFPEDLNRDGKMVRVMLTSTHRRWMIVMVLILVSATAQMVSADCEVTWYWSDTDATFSHPTDTNYKFHKLMDKDEPTGTTDYTVSLNKGESAWWYTHEAAERDLTFPAGNWKAIYWAETNSDNEHRIYARLYVVKDDGSKTLIGERYNTLKHQSSPKRKERLISTSSPTNVNQGDRLAVQIEWSGNAESGEVLTVHYNNYQSCLVSPPNSPPWPVPELPTVILFSTGLLILAGYVYMGKRNK